MGKIHIMDHPLIQHKIGIIRRTETGSRDFRTLISEIAMLMCYEATRELELVDVEIDTPICKTSVKELKGKKMAVIPILRAGLGMVDGMSHHGSRSEGGAYRLVPGSGNCAACGILLQAAQGLCRQRCVCGGSHAGYRRFRSGGHYDAQR